MDYALQQLDISPLMRKINELIEIFGGIAYAFDMEWKIRLFIVAVLDFCLISQTIETEWLKQTLNNCNKQNLNFGSFKEFGGLKIDGEKAIE